MHPSKSFPQKVWETFFIRVIISTGDNMGKFYLITGDIINKSKGMDAIVNAQNRYMSHGSGICGAIYNASGFELDEYY